MFFGGGWHLRVCVYTSRARHELGVPDIQPLLMGLSSFAFALLFFPVTHWCLPESEAPAFNLQLVFIK